jgi:hypothetical protein
MTRVGISGLGGKFQALPEIIIGKVRERIT